MPVFGDPTRKEAFKDIHPDRAFVQTTAAVSPAGACHGEYLGAIELSKLMSKNDFDDDKVDEVWAAEIQRRIESIDKGEVALVPWDDVLGEMQRHAQE